MISDRVQHPFVKDIAWLVEGHYIERDFELEPYWLPDVEAQLLALDDQPQPLVDAVTACKSHFLGSYFETLFSFAIRHLSVLTVHYEHVQIVSEVRTLGEVDMLVETPEGQLHQFEIAIKFYLERQDLYPDHWIGPNKNDSLLKKVSRARDHQLQILQTEEGKSAIAEVAQGRTPQANLLIFGRLYSALDQGYDISSWLTQTNYGGWVRASDFMSLKSYFSNFFVLQKPHWLSSPAVNENISFNFPQFAYNLVGEILQDSRPRHVFLWQAADAASGDIGKHLFVVPDSW
ncbi:hypothetical protein DFP75_102315 [Marinomonas alcarazii]|uniref:DUF1853 family protein n=1 Tax=Marinomonas alcarazii TaxID=491949 RepID=A0A318V5W5_9GAMM|nr:DUF1853 family protein [Marinomonas alcarazii]PYF83221.1 hypothetical protein DFP75_102315 [Marinomonas alcarazii]